jgi:hypothetical protein
MKVVLLGILTLALQLGYSGAIPVSERDPIYPYLAEYQQEVEERTAEGGYETASFQRWAWAARSTGSSPS